MCRFGIGILIALPTALAFAQGDCNALRDASEKAAATPSHQFITETAQFRDGGHPASSEIITTSDHRYIRVDGIWKSRVYDAKKEGDRRKKMSASGESVCKYERDELVDNQAAAVYSEHTDELSALLWVSKSTGLPLKSEIDIDAGGTLGKSHRTIRFDYANIAVPSVVQ